jgi:hypothetical protein
VSSRRATVQGEVHAGQTDARALQERGLEQYDAVLVEGRSPTLVVEDLTLGYAGFLMGYVTLAWLQVVASRVRDRTVGRFGATADLRAAADRAGVDYHDRIDADTATVYELVPTSVRYLLGTVLLGLLALVVAAGVHRAVVALFAISLPYLYATLAVAVVKATGGGRARHMAETVTDLADARSYDRVAVLCGDAHREDVGEALERREWSVETYRSRHPLGRLFRW